MARSNRKKSSATPANAFAKYDFINYQLTVEEKKACKAWCDQRDVDVLTVLDELTSDGYKVSISSDKDNKAAFATLTNKSADVSFQNKVLSIRAKDGAEALLRLFWLHFIQADADWSNLTSALDDDIW